MFNKDIWPFSFPRSHNEGFSNSEVEKLVKGSSATRTDFVSRLFWTTEVYSFGKAYREWLDIPRWLPLPFYGDHGYSPYGYLQNHERNNSSNIHVTFNKYRYEAIKDKYDKRILYIPNPWINYRKQKGITPSPERKGTLVFYSHSITNVDIIDYDFEKYFSQLRSLPEKYHPLVFMFHINDIQKGHHQFIRERGFPVVTAGNQNDPLFIDRFYDIVRNFEFATSNSGGSELFYCTELGIKYFILGEKPVFYNSGHKENPSGKLNDRDKLQQKLNRKKRDLFHYKNEVDQREKDQFVKDSLGLSSDIDSNDFWKIIKKEYLRLAPYCTHKILLSYLRSFKRALNKH